MLKTKGIQIDELKVGPDGIIRILASFSGGETSSVLTEKLLRHYRANFDERLKMHVGVDSAGVTVHIKVVFFNTSREKNQTLDFVHECDKRLGFKTVWLEAVVNEGYRVATTHREVDYKTAKRDGSVFESMVVKYALPNFLDPHCTRELKTRPSESYTKSIGWGPAKPYYKAIGYRIDEPKRFDLEKKRKNQREQNIIIPLADWWPMSKPDVKKWCSSRAFELGFEYDFEGNCMFCVKKNVKKLIAQARIDCHGVPWVVDLERKYGAHVPPTKKNFKLAPGETIKMFRESMSINDIINAEREYFSACKTKDDEKVYIDILLNLAAQSSSDEDGCAESCEMVSL